MATTNQVILNKHAKGVQAAKQNAKPAIINKGGKPSVK